MGPELRGRGFSVAGGYGGGRLRVSAIKLTPDAATAGRLQQLTDLPGRLRRRLATERAERRLLRDFRALMESAPRAYAHRKTLDGRPRIAVATYGSGIWHLVLEVLLAHALALRGATPELFICDLPSLPVCDERTSLLRDPLTCHGCLPAKRPLLDVCQIPWRGMSAFLDEDAATRAGEIVAALRDDQLVPHVHGGWPVGRWTYVSACHFLRGDARGDDREKVLVRRAFLASAIVVVEATGRWLDAVRPDILVAESGAHFMWRIAFELARARGCRVVCREIGKGGFDCHIYALNAECMFPDWSAIWNEARHVALSNEQRERAHDYLRRLPSKTYARQRDEAPAMRPAHLRQQLELRSDRKTAVLFTNVTWDLATAGRDVGFDGMFDWMAETIRLAESRRDLQLVIRVHPAERAVPTRERALEWISSRWPVLPANVKTIAPDTAVAARDLLAVADLVLTYCSTAGIEAAVDGRPVMVAGAPHYRGKGFTIDVESRDDYADRWRRWQDGALAVPPDSAETALRYFHLFFLRYHIEMGWTTSPLEPPFRLTIGELSELLPGRSRAVDAVCGGILEGREILLPAL
jgi:hypothetical protein